MNINSDDSFVINNLIFQWLNNDLPIDNLIFILVVYQISYLTKITAMFICCLRVICPNVRPLSCAYFTKFSSERKQTRDECWLHKGIRDSSRSFLWSALFIRYYNKRFAILKLGATTGLVIKWKWVQNWLNLHYHIYGRKMSPIVRVASNMTLSSDSKRNERKRVSTQWIDM